MRRWRASAAGRMRWACSIRFLDDPSVRLIGVEAGGHGIETGEHAASLTGGRPGVLARQPHVSAAGTMTGRSSRRTRSAPGWISGHWAGAFVAAPISSVVEYVSATDEEALAAFQLCTRTEGIIPALEPAHALAHVTKMAPAMDKNEIILIEFVRARAIRTSSPWRSILGVKL